MQPQATPYDILPIAVFGWTPGLALWLLLALFLALALGVMLLPARGPRRGKGDACTLLLASLRRIAQGATQLGPQELNAVAQDLKLYLSLAGYPQALRATSAEIEQIAQLQANSLHAPFWDLLQQVEERRFRPPASAGLTQLEFLQLVDRCSAAAVTLAAQAAAARKGKQSHA